MHLPELLCVLVLVTYIADIRSVSEKPPEGLTEIPPALTMESFEDHVLGYVMKEKFWFHPTNISDPFWFFVRLHVTKQSQNEIHVRKTGDDSDGKGGLICRNITDVFYSINETSAEFINKDGTLYVFASNNPYRHILGSTCRNWVPGMKYCSVKDVYANLFEKGDEDIEYYEYENDVESRRRFHLGPYLELVRGSEIREQVDMGFGATLPGGCKYNDDSN